jgi:hypothetical protein
MLRPCLGIDGQPCPNLTERTRCPHHQRALNQRTWAGKSDRYNTQYRHERAALLATHPLCHWCGAPATTADHTPNGLMPACKPCNSARGGRAEA